MPSLCKSDLQKGSSHCFLGLKFANNPNTSSPPAIGDLAISPIKSIKSHKKLKSLCSLAITILTQKVSFLAMVAQFDVPLSLRALDTVGNKELLADSGTTYTWPPRNILATPLRVGIKDNIQRSKERQGQNGVQTSIFVTKMVSTISLT